MVSNALQQLFIRPLLSVLNVWRLPKVFPPFVVDCVDVAATTRQLSMVFKNAIAKIAPKSMQIVKIVILIFIYANITLKGEY